MTMMRKCCCGGCTGEADATCDPVSELTADYSDTLPDFVSVEIDVTWDGDPHTFIFTMKKFVSLCDENNPTTTTYPSCSYRMYCGTDDLCDPWPNTISGTVKIGNLLRCEGMEVDCNYPCADQKNPNNISSAYKAIFVCEILNYGDGEAFDENICPGGATKARCRFQGVIGVRMALACSGDTSFLNSGTISIVQDVYDSTHLRKNANQLSNDALFCDEWTYANVTNDYCFPAFLYANLPYMPQCDGSAGIGDYGDEYLEVFSTELSNQYPLTCPSPLLGSYPLESSGDWPHYSGVFDAISDGTNFVGALSTCTYSTCCGSPQPTGQASIAFEITRFEVS